ncbi:MAG: DUF4097 family beta strand repeat-containing protein [Candidatus Zixiibacteriota bacterium]
MRSSRTRTESERAGFIALVVTVLLANLAAAQTALPPNIENSKPQNKKAIVLSRESRELAEEYADLLEELRDLTADYQEYLEEYNDKILRQYQDQLSALAGRIDNGTYASEPEQLSADLLKSETELQKLETEIQESKTVYPVKLFYLVRGLRREMSSTRRLLLDEMEQKLVSHNVQLAAIEEYVRSVLEGIQVRWETAPDGSTIYYVQSDPSAPRPRVYAKVVLTEDSTKAPEHPEVGFAVPEPPTPPDVDYAPVGTPLAPGEVGQSKLLTANVTVDSDRLPIAIFSRMGDVEVQGSEGQQIAAELSIEVSGESRTVEKKFLAGTRLEVTSSDKGYDIRATIPSDRSRSLRVLNSRLVVSVPARNYVVCENSYGNVTITELQNGVRVKGSYSSLDISEIKGGVTAATTMGAASIYEASGPISIKTAYAPVTVATIRGDVTIENAYGTVVVSDCRGKATITNSGQVSISDHVGDVKITNTLGPVEIADISGNVRASNAFQPVSIHNVDGSVTVENSNSAIQLSEIGGMLSASNKFGQIMAEDLRGPVNLVNQNGNVIVALDRALGGTSSIRTTFGNINVSVPSTADLFVDARTVFGDIRSFMPLKVIGQGTSKAAVLTIGKGGDSLLLVGSNSSIVIDEKR